MNYAQALVAAIWLTCVTWMGGHTASQAVAQTRTVQTKKAVLTASAKKKKPIPTPTSTPTSTPTPTATPAPTPSATPPVSSTALLSDTFTQADGVITNEFTHWNPGSAGTHVSSVWDMDSGSLFAKGNTAWTGVPNDQEPNADSNPGNNSAIFRLNTKNFGYGDVNVGFKLFQNNLVTTPSTPAVDWDGVHIFLHYQSEYNLYYASVNRRDGHVVIKKKCVGGSDNGGTYYALAEKSGYPIPFGTWQNVSASVKNVSASQVNLKLYLAGTQVLDVTDSGTGCAAITKSGATGVRGDNDNFQFDDFTVTAL